MTQFSGYAKYYDDMYQNKPYEAEVDKLEAFFRKHSKHPVKTILSLGCGTCTYEIILARRGYTIHGIDISADMLKEGKAKVEEAGLSDKITLQQGNMETVKIDGAYDAVLMMFNIAGYVRTESALTSVAKNVSDHLKTGGVFIFDAWNDAAVIADPPTDRTKVVEKDGSKITRLTKGVLDQENHLVKITFDVTEEKNGLKNQSVVEEHPMRYWSQAEIANSLAAGGLTLVQATSFENIEKPISDREWDMFVVARK